MGARRCHPGRPVRDPGGQALGPGDPAGLGRGGEAPGAVPLRPPARRHLPGPLHRHDGERGHAGAAPDRRSAGRDHQGQRLGGGERHHLQPGRRPEGGALQRERLRPRRRQPLPHHPAGRLRGDDPGRVPEPARGDQRPAPGPDGERDRQVGGPHQPGRDPGHRPAPADPPGHGPPKAGGPGETGRDPAVRGPAAVPDQHRRGAEAGGDQAGGGRATGGHPRRRGPKAGDDARGGGSGPGHRDRVPGDQGQRPHPRAAGGAPARHPGQVRRQPQRQDGGAGGELGAAGGGPGPAVGAGRGGVGGQRPLPPRRGVGLGWRRPAGRRHPRWRKLQMAAERAARPKAASTATSTQIATGCPPRVRESRSRRAPGVPPAPSTTRRMGSTP